MNSLLSEVMRLRLRVLYSKPGSLEVCALSVSKISPSRSISSGSAKRERSSSSCKSLVPEHWSGLSVTLEREMHYKKIHKRQGVHASVSSHLTCPHMWCRPLSVVHCPGGWDACVSAGVVETEKQSSIESVEKQTKFRK